MRESGGMTARPLIVGVGETAYHRLPTRGTLPLLASAARIALQDAGLSPGDVDGLAVSSFTLAPDHAVDVAWRLGLRLRWLMDDSTGGGSALNMLAHARQAVESGEAGVVLLLAGDAFGAGDFERLTAEYNTATRDHLAPLPSGGPNALFALLTRRHMAEHGLERRHYGEVVVAQRQWAALNPQAIRRSPLTLDEYLAAPTVVDPLTRHDCAPVVAGADAIVVSTGERAQRRPAVGVSSQVSSFNEDQQEGEGTRTALRQLRDELWDRAGIGPGEVHVTSVYDDYPVMVLVQLDDLGFAPDGDLSRLIGEGITARRLPLNTSGGQLSAGQAGAAGGMHGLVEAVRQLRGREGARQVDGARIAVVTGYGMVLYRYGTAASAAVLERVD